MSENATKIVDPAAKSMDDIMALCKRRGFIYPASEIYGGINGFWDYGPLGAQLKKNLRDAWWRDVVEVPPIGPDGSEVRIVPVDSCIIQNPKVWEASGHVAGFHDLRVECKECKSRFRADQVVAGPVFQFSGNLPMAGTWDQVDFLEYPKGKNPVARLWWVLGDPPEAVEESAKKILSVKKVKIHVVPLKPPEIGSSLQALFLEADGQLLLWRATYEQFEPLAPGGRCPRCGGALTEPRDFNLMFPTYVGATATEDDKAYLRPETAQGIFINFKNIMDSTRVKIPFGIAQVGKAFRNEVTPRNFTFRSREFEQMEIEFFCTPDEHAGEGPSVRDWYTFWRDWRHQWWLSVGLSPDNLSLREHDADELAHYAKTGVGTTDIEYRFPFTAPGFGELEGVADRTDFDLRQHAEHSGAKLAIFDQERKARYLPNVIEPSAGLDRGVLALLCDAYTPDPDRPSKVFLKFHPRMAPIKAAVFPLVAKEGMPEVAEKLARELKQRFGAVDYDAKQSIGKRYARMDEAGCPFCFTIDGQTLEEQTVTVRDRDTAGQERIGIDKVVGFLEEKLGSRQ